MYLLLKRRAEPVLVREGEVEQSVQPVWPVMKSGRSPRMRSFSSSSASERTASLLSSATAPTWSVS